MSRTSPPRVLAIGLDATESRFVRKLIEEGQMPALQRLLSQGRWMRVESTAQLGSGSVWPTFISGQDPKAHGVYGEWLWHPETMKLSRYGGNNLTPFWKALAESGVRVGILDVPFMPMVGLSEGFEISEWGPHDVLEGKTQIRPAGVAELVAKKPQHPLRSGTTVSGPHDYHNLQKLGRACLKGIKLRGALARDLIAETKPQFSLVAFTEVHRSAHYLWHKAEPEHQVYHNKGFVNLTTTRPTMLEIYHELDRQVGELINTVGDEASVMVFALHGMRPAHGAPAFLTPLLCELGLARFAEWRDQSWRDRAKGFMARIKRRSPARLKRLYYQIAPATTTHRLARPTMLPLYDWSQTRAFVLPSDQHGWIRINLMGRESRGIVPAEDYQDICAGLEKRLRDLKSESGAPLVREITRTADRVEDALSQRIPDIVIHWTDAVFESPLRIGGSSIAVEAIGRKYVGQHSPDGFCILRSAIDIGDQKVLSSKDMHRLIMKLLTS